LQYNIKLTSGFFVCTHYNYSHSSYHKQMTWPRLPPHAGLSDLMGCVPPWSRITWRTLKRTQMNT